MNVLFIAYYFEPFSGVGAKRITYWAKNLKRLDPRIKNCHVVTTIEQDQTIQGVDKVFVVPTSPTSLFGRVFKFDVGAAWLKNLDVFLASNEQTIKYDYVILTGNPFFHFFILRKINKMGGKAIIDFRDPLANNPRSVKADSMKRKLKHYLITLVEYYFIKNADITITVNKYCAKLLSGYANFKKKIKVIDNGFDESYFMGLSEPEYNEEVMNLVYAGSLYADRSASCLIQTISSTNDFIFNHIGNINADLNGKPNVVSHGLKSYKETLKLMNDCQVTVIFTSGFEFESTTKIFDYIALNKIILIVTEGIIKTGALHDITADYPNVYWAKNTEESINKVLIDIKLSPLNLAVVEPMKHSRESGLNQLINLMK